MRRSALEREKAKLEKELAAARLVVGVQSKMQALRRGGAGRLVPGAVINLGRVCPGLFPWNLTGAGREGIVTGPQSDSRPRAAGDPAQGNTAMTEPTAHDGAYSADSAPGYLQETPEQRYERRSRNAAVSVAVVAVVTLLVLLVMGFAVLFVFHAVASVL